MYAYVKKPDGTFYRSVVFAYDYMPCDLTDHQAYLYSIHHRYFLVLNEEKNALVKHRLFPEGNASLIVHALLVDTDQTGWYIRDEHFACAAFLKDVDFSGETSTVSPELLARCIAMDAAYVYQEYRTLATAEDAEELLGIAGDFHDASVKAVETTEDTVYVRFGSCWGYLLDMWFDGDAAQQLGVGVSGEIWLDATLIYEDGLWQLTSSGLATCDPTAEERWVCGRNVRYRIVPY